MAGEYLDFFNLLPYNNHKISIFKQLKKVFYSIQIDISQFKFKEQKETNNYIKSLFKYSIYRL